MSRQDIEQGGSAREYVFYGFETTHQAMMGESVLEREGVVVRVVPTPRVFGSLCGLALRVSPSDAPRSEDAMRAACLTWANRARISDI